jgi:hypothetical protein
MGDSCEEKVDDRVTGVPVVLHASRGRIEGVPDVDDDEEVIIVVVGREGFVESWSIR